MQQQPVGGVQGNHLLVVGRKSHVGGAQRTQKTSPPLHNSICNLGFALPARSAEMALPSRLWLLLWVVCLQAWLSLQADLNPGTTGPRTRAAAAPHPSPAAGALRRQLGGMFGGQPMCCAAHPFPLASAGEALLHFASMARGVNQEALADWSSGTNPCTWTGVTCSGTAVTALHLPRAGLQGSLSPELAHLTSLQQM